MRREFSGECGWNRQTSRTSTDNDKLKTLLVLPLKRRVEAPSTELNKPIRIAYSTTPICKHLLFRKGRTEKETISYKARTWPRAQYWPSSTHSKDDRPPTPHRQGLTCDSRTVDLTGTSHLPRGILVSPRNLFHRCSTIVSSETKLFSPRNTPVLLQFEQRAGNAKKHVRKPLKLFRYCATIPLLPVPRFGFRKRKNNLWAAE